MSAYHRMSGQIRKNDRRCIVTRAALTGEVSAIRFVLSPERYLVADLYGTLPGRGAWVMCRKSLVAQALSQGGFKRALKSGFQLADGRAPADYLDWLGKQLRLQALAALGLMKRAGGLVTGYDMVRATLQKDVVCAYIMARDGSTDATSRLRGIITAREGQGDIEKVEVVDLFDKEELAQALGLENPVHLCITNTARAKPFLWHVKRAYSFDG